MRNNKISSGKNRYYKDYTGIYDIINILLGVCIIICSTIMFVDVNEHEGLFGPVFILSALMNLVLGIKYFKRHEVVHAILLFVVFVLLVAIGVVSIIAL